MQLKDFPDCWLRWLKNYKPVGWLETSVTYNHATKFSLCDRPKETQKHCDQMASLFFKIIWPFTTVNICSITWDNCQSRFIICPKTVKDFKFCQFGHRDQKLHLLKFQRRKNQKKVFPEFRYFEESFLGREIDFGQKFEIDCDRRFKLKATKGGCSLSLSLSRGRDGNLIWNKP